MKVLALILFLFLNFAVSAQSALDGFDPNPNGIIRSIVVQPDGKILIGGDFTSIAPNGGASVTRNHIARLNRDGSLDTGFNPNANDLVYVIVLQSDGKILVGGAFNGVGSIGGQTRNYIARLDAVTGLADSFDPNANGELRSIAVQADGKILVGGFFSGANSIGGQARSRIARLDPVTGMADSFDPGATNAVYAIVPQPNGKILVGGAFNGAIGGQTRSRIARLDAATGLADSFNPSASSTVFAIAVQADGKIWAGGNFNGVNSIGGQARDYIARLDPVTGLADSFNPDPDNSVLSILVEPDGNILIGGAFTVFQNGTNSRLRIARLQATDGLPHYFNPVADMTVRAVALQPDGKVIVGGDFTTLSPTFGPPVTRSRLARVDGSYGKVDQTLNLSMVGGSVYSTAVQPDGKVIIGGSFSQVLGVTRNNIARLYPDGTLDVSFNPNANGLIYSIAVQTDGKILVGGKFSGTNSIGGQTRNHIARLNPFTGTADSFDPNANFDVYSIVVQSDGKILVGGFFVTIGGQTRSNIARLDPVTGLADSFDPIASNFVTSIALQADGKILTGGFFTSIGGQTRNRIARLDPVTGLADSFNPNANSEVDSIVVQPDGKILVGGFFNSSLGTPTIGGQTRNRIARLDPVTGLAEPFNPNANDAVLSIAVQADGGIIVGGDFNGANSIGGATRNYIARLDSVTGGVEAWNPNADSGVRSIAIQADGKILAGGFFTSIGGQTRSLFARLNNNVNATQNLAVAQNSVTWTLSGSSPQFERVIFEDSTDNLNYNFLGNGTATGNSWMLTGLNLSYGQNLYIRARGFRGSGYLNSSESYQESVRNVYLVPTITGTVTYGNAIGAPTPRFVSNVLLSGAGATSPSALTGFPNGDYALTGFGSGAYTVTPSKIGGVNNSIPSFDAGRIALHVAGPPNPQLTASQLIAADVSGNGIVSSFDAAMIAKYVAGPPYAAPGIGSTGTWKFSPVNRNYASVGSNITGEDYLGFLMGEVSGNWTNTGARPTNRP